jgi:hypothetical protein
VRKLGMEKHFQSFLFDGINRYVYDSFWDIHFLFWIPFIWTHSICCHSQGSQNIWKIYMNVHWRVWQNILWTVVVTLEHGWERRQWQDFRYGPMYQFSKIR